MTEAGLPPLERAYETLKGKKILYMMADEFACGHYRCRIPARYLAAADIYAVPMFGLWHEEGWWPRGFGEEFDIVIAQRQISDVAFEKVKEWKEQGKLVITEVDDFLHGVLPTSPAYATYKPGSEVLRITSKFLELSDAVTVSTPELADAYRAYNRNIYVVPNAIDFEIRNWGPPPGGPVKPKDMVVFGWADLHAEADVPRLCSTKCYSSPTCSLVQVGAIERAKALGRMVEPTMYRRSSRVHNRVLEPEDRCTTD